MLSEWPVWKTQDHQVNSTLKKSQVKRSFQLMSSIHLTLKWIYESKTKFSVIWENTDYNIGNGLNINNGKFTAPVDGIYFFYSKAQTNGSKSARIDFYLNGSGKSYGFRDENGEWDMVSVSSQFKLNKGDTVWVYFSGYYSTPTNALSTFFEGHLIRQISS